MNKPPSDAAKFSRPDSEGRDSNIHKSGDRSNTHAATNDPMHGITDTGAVVGVIMGSQSDWETMRQTCEVLETLAIRHEKFVVSAHRTPSRMVAYASRAASRGLKVIIAGAGGAAHLPGMVASETQLPVIGVPIQSRSLQGLDSLLSIVQMPGGIPVATMAIGSAGAKNAAILAARILSLGDADVLSKLNQFVQQQTDAVMNLDSLS